MTASSLAVVLVMLTCWVRRRVGGRPYVSVDIVWCDVFLVLEGRVVRVRVVMRYERVVLGEGRLLEGCDLLLDVADK